MNKVYNLIFAQHLPNSKYFLFQLPVNVAIRAGQQIYVDTIRGEAEATAATNNFHVDTSQFMAIVKGCGAYHPVKFVTGIQRSIRTFEKAPLMPEPTEIFDLPF